MARRPNYGVEKRQKELKKAKKKEEKAEKKRLKREEGTSGAPIVGLDDEPGDSEIGGNGSDSDRTAHW